MGKLLSNKSKQQEQIQQKKMQDRRPHEGYEDETGHSEHEGLKRSGREATSSEMLCDPERLDHGTTGNKSSLHDFHFNV